MLYFKDFSKNYNDHLVISIPELKLERGIYWIRGENGSGKSSLFRSLAGLLPYHGSIILANNIDLRQQPLEFRRRVNFSEAEPSFPGFLTAKDLVRFVGTARAASMEQQDEIVQKFGVDKFFDNRCETYSSGMLKKVSLVLAFLGRPEVIILDEPLITLDEASRNVLVKTIAAANVITLFSSHQSINLAVDKSFSITNKVLVADE
jgi:ABC-2 type transport system ATP-binding protein